MKVFKEEQRFTQTWLHILLIITFVTTILAVAKEWNDNLDQSIEANLSSLFTIISLILVHFLIYFSNLKTKIDEKGIHYQFFPFHFSNKNISWVDISKIYVRSYNPISEYGGWGLRYTFNKKRGNALNVSGDIGIQLELKNGKKLLIGTQKKEEATRVLETYKNKIIKT